MILTDYKIPPMTGLISVFATGGILYLYLLYQTGSVMKLYDT